VTPIPDTSIRATLLRLARERGPEKSFCPSDAARSLSANWRPLMPDVRRVAQQLVDDGMLFCTQRGRPAQPLTTHGAIRLRAHREDCA
jgi:hypothetical protein